jgi:SAM-dependent methyltransferase
MHLTKRQSCRVCGSRSLVKVIDLGEQCLQGSFLKLGQEAPPMRRIPTSLVRCDPAQEENACGLLQMEYTVPPAILYSNYWYRSGTNQTMRDHLRGIAVEAANLSEKPDAKVLDIGCNDGTLLANYSDTFIKFGVDPSDVAVSASAKFKLVQDVFPSAELLDLLGTQKFDIITSIAMFYDLEDPVLFVRGIRDVLAPDGLWIFEMSYMPSMLEANSYDTICHEHLEYYSLAVIENVLRRADLKAFRATFNSINGGSIRVYATHAANFKFKNPTYAEELRKLRQQEFDLELDTDKPYRNFQDRINVHRQELNNLLKKLKREGKRIHIYGASTKGNTILQWCGIDNRIIDFAAERNPEKFGAQTLSTDIPIISEKESRALKPDYYLVLPWHFADEFLEREREMILSGTAMIFPLPQIKVIDKFSLILSDQQCG